MGCFSCLQKIPPSMQIYIVLVVFIILGIVEYGADTAENYIIASKSQTDELIYQYSNNILGIFLSVFSFVNLVFTTTMAFKDAKPSEPGKPKNISKIFHFGIGFACASGMLVMFILLFLRSKLFGLIQRQEYAAGATEFFWYFGPLTPLAYVNDMIMSLMEGMLLLKELIVIVIVTNVLYIAALLLLLKFSSDTIMAIGVANIFYELISLAAFIAVFYSESFRKKYIISDFSYIRYWRKKPEEQKGLLNGDGERKDGTRKFKQMGIATFLVVLRNLASTVAYVVSTSLLTAKLPTNQFVANNVVSNTLQLAPFGDYFATLLTVFGPRFIVACDKQSYKSTIVKGHINIALATVGSLIAIFVFHTGEVSLNRLTSSDNRAEVTKILTPIWPIWIVGLILNMYNILYTTTLVNFEKYAILTVSGVITTLGTLPLIFLYALKYHDLLGFYLAPTITSLVSLVIGASIFHLKLMKDPKWKHKERVLVEVSIW